MSSSSTRVFTIPLRGFQAVIFDLDGVVIRQEQLAEQGVEVYESTVELIRELRRKDVKTAIVSSSRNCVPVLRAAGLLDLFDARIDGSDLERLGLQDKPKAAMFLAAVNQLGVEPACAVVVCAVVVEDSISSVEAGSAGKFGMVIAVDHARHAEALRQAGANLVVQDLAQIRIRHGPPVEVDARELPSALDCLDEIGSFAWKKRLVVFLDYDGTLTPIVPRPEDAVLSEEVRRAIKALAARYTVAVISGRGLADVRALVAIDNILYAGSHGFEIAGPEGWQMDYEQETSFLPVLDRVQNELQAALAEIGGAGDEPLVKGAVDDVLSRHERLRASPGKKVWDIQPDIEWNKGKALQWLLESLGIDSCATLPLYIGDDTTDEDAFRVVHDRGIGIVVRDEPRSSVAQYALNSTEEVRTFIEALASSPPEAVAR